MNKINKIQNNKFNSSKSNIEAIQPFLKDIKPKSKTLPEYGKNLS